MGFLDKISSLIFEEDSSSESNSASSRKFNWRDIFFEEETNKEETNKEETNKEEKNEKEKNVKNFLDIFFEDVPDDGIKITFTDEENVVDDISSQIESKESELRNLGDFFKTVNPKDYPDSATEYEAYLNLMKQLKQIKIFLDSSKNTTIDSMRNYQLESMFRKFELDYQTNINAIQSLCYLSEISLLNSEMSDLFHSNFTKGVEHRVTQIKDYITLISKKSNKFDKKYSSRLYKELIEAEYRLILLKLMGELKNDMEPRKNPFSSFSLEKKKIFEAYLSKDIRDSNTKYNVIADSMDEYIKKKIIDAEKFSKVNKIAELISENINKYVIDDFRVMELFENGEGYETLKNFLRFKLKLNYIDNKIEKANSKNIEDSCK